MGSQFHLRPRFQPPPKNRASGFPRRGSYELSPQARNLDLRSQNHFPSPDVVERSVKRAHLDHACLGNSALCRPPTDEAAFFPSSFSAARQPDAAKEVRAEHLFGSTLNGVLNSYPVRLASPCRPRDPNSTSRGCDVPGGGIHLQSGAVLMANPAVPRSHARPVPPRPRRAASDSKLLFFLSLCLWLRQMLSRCHSFGEHHALRHQLRGRRLWEGISA